MMSKIQSTNQDTNKLNLQSRSFSHGRIFDIKPSIVYLSSLFQMQRKRKINKQILDFTRRFQSGSNTERYNLTAREKQRPKLLELVSQRQIKTSDNFKKRKVSQDQIFLSQITDQECPVNPKDSQQKSTQRLARNKRRNFNMRKLQFHQYIKRKLLKQSFRPEDNCQIKQVIYQKQAQQIAYKSRPLKRINKSFSLSRPSPPQ